MKRKLIDYDSFEKIKSESLTNVQAELEAAGEMLAETLGLEGLSVDSYGAQGVLFESGEGDFVKADYKMGDGYVQFDNIEQVVLSEAGENEKAREIVSKMIDSLIESDDAAASERLAEWFDMPRSKRILTESGRGKRQPAWVVAARVKGKKKSFMKKSAAERKRDRDMRKKVKLGNDERRVPQRRQKNGKPVIVGWKKKKKNQWGKKRMKEWTILAESVLDFVDYNVNGPMLDCPVLRKEGEIVGVRVPTVKVRNEAKILRFDWKTMNTDVMIKRNAGKRLAENGEFAKSVLELKRLNALSDSKAFEESVERTASGFPQVIYLTEGELAGIVKSVLEGAKASNFDDETCSFLAEALIRTVHENYVDTVGKIVKLAGGKINEKAADKYAEFKNIAEGFYASLDEQAALEMQAFVDVYEALRQVHESAKTEGDEQLADLAGAHLDGLLPIVAGKAEMDFDMLGEAAEWLYDIVEESSEWGEETPVVRADGEHPEVIKKGKTVEYPAEMRGTTPDQHHVSDGKDYSGEAARELANDGWSNIGGEGVYPSLDNPYVPKADVPKIVGEKDVDSDSDQLAHWGDNDTWPSLQNPYSKPSVTPKEAK